MNKLYDFLDRYGAKKEIASRAGVTVQYVRCTLKSNKEFYQLTATQQKIVRIALEYMNECKATEKELQTL